MKPIKTDYRYIIKSNICSNRKNNADDSVTVDQEIISENDLQGTDGIRNGQSTRSLRIENSGHRRIVRYRLCYTT